MKITSPLVAALASTALALPIVERQSSSADALAEMLKGAADFSPKFLAGDPAGVATALGDMVTGAATYPLAYLSELGKTAGGKAAGSKAKRQAQPLSSANSLADMLKGATDFAPKYLAGDSKGVTTALEQMLGGAASFTPGFFNDLGKAAAGAKLPAKRQAPPAAAGGLSTSTSIANMVNGATDFSPKFLAGDSQGVATALAQMLGGAASFTPGFFSDLAKASQNAAASIPQAKGPAKE
jgi:hypothetical protein